MHTLSHFEHYKKAARDLEEADRWLAHRGKLGHCSDTPADLSVAHSEVKLTIPMQYSAGGKNYWDSPAEFNAALKQIIFKHRELLLSEARAWLQANVDANLLHARDELQAALSDANTVLENAREL